MLSNRLKFWKQYQTSWTSLWIRDNTRECFVAPAIRVVDEHGHEVHDRYYKMGSAIDLTCQVAVSFLSVLPTVMPAPNPPHYSPQRQFPFIPKLVNFTVTPHAIPKIPHSHSAGGASTTVTFPHIPQLSNLRGHALGGHDTRQLEFFHQKLTWHKDGGPIPKDVQLNLRYSNTCCIISNPISLSQPFFDFCQLIDSPPLA